MALTDATTPPGARDERYYYQFYRSMLSPARSTGGYQYQPDSHACPQPYQQPPHALMATMAAPCTEAVMGQCSYSYWGSCAQAVDPTALDTRFVSATPASGGNTRDVPHQQFGSRSDIRCGGFAFTPRAPTFTLPAQDCVGPTPARPPTHWQPPRHRWRQVISSSVTASSADLQSRNPATSSAPASADVSVTAVPVKASEGPCEEQVAADLGSMSIFPNGITPIHFARRCQSYCLLCGAHGHAYADCDVFCGTIVCLFSQRDTGVYCMSHPDWSTSATLGDVVHFAQHTMHLVNSTFDIFLDGQSLAAAVSSSHDAKLGCAPSMQALTPTQLRTRCQSLHILPGCVLYVAACPPASSTSAAASAALSVEPSLDGSGHVDDMAQTVEVRHRDKLSADVDDLVSNPAGQHVEVTDGAARTHSPSSQSSARATAPSSPPPSPPAMLTVDDGSRRGCTLFINFIAPSLSDSAIRDLLDSFGTVRRVRLSAAPPARAREAFRFAFVEYASRESAAKARIALHRRPLSGFTLSAQVARNGIVASSDQDEGESAGSGCSCAFGRVRDVTSGTSSALLEASRDGRGGTDEGGNRPAVKVRVATSDHGGSVRQQVPRSAAVDVDLTPQQALCVLTYVCLHSASPQETARCLFTAWGLSEGVLHTQPGWPVRTMTARAAAAMLLPFVGSPTLVRDAPGHVPTVPEAHPVLLALETLVLQVSLFLLRHDRLPCAVLTAEAVTTALRVVADVERHLVVSPHGHVEDGAATPALATLSQLEASTWAALFTPVAPPQQGGPVDFAACVRDAAVPARRGVHSTRDSAVAPPMYLRADVLNCVLLRLCQLWILVEVAEQEATSDDTHAPTSAARYAACRTRLCTCGCALLHRWCFGITRSHVAQADSVTVSAWWRALCYSVRSGLSAHDVSAFLSPKAASRPSSARTAFYAAAVLTALHHEQTLPLFSSLDSHS